MRGYVLLCFLCFMSAGGAQEYCFTSEEGLNAVHSLIPGGEREKDNPPIYWYLGMFENDNWEACRDECAKIDLCAAYALHTGGHGDTWRNRCYGRSTKRNVWREDNNIISGQKIPCSQVCPRPSITGKSAIEGIITTPGIDNRPESFYFGDWYLDYACESVAIETCRLSCAVERMCYAWSLFTESATDSSWRGHCYGVGSALVGGDMTDKAGVTSSQRTVCGNRCFASPYDMNPMKGLVTSPGQSNPPNSFYFGNFGSDTARCEARCQEEPDCTAFVHYKMDYPTEAWRGGCYGRDITTVGEEREQGVLGSRHIPCEEVCFHHHNSINTVMGLVTSPGTENRPNTFYFGDYFNDDHNACANACAFTTACDAYTLFGSSYPDAAYRGHCYGRGIHSTVEHEEQHVYGGTRRTCQRVCMDEEWERSTIKGLVANPKDEKRPETFYFGDFGDDIERCQRACMLEHNCYSYTLFTNSHLIPGWRGLCYGRNLFNQINEPEEHAVSGYQHTCSPVCMDRVYDRNTIHSLVGVKSGTRPYTFYFGDFGSNVDRCEHACLMEPLCHSYTLHLREFGGRYAGLCYGRSSSYDTSVVELLIVSGIKEPCSEKCFDRKANHHTMQNMVTEPGVCNPPKTMCYGLFKNNEDMCKAACYSDHYCDSYTFYREDHPDEHWRGQCIGRNSEEEPEATENGVISGKRKPCNQVCFDYELHRNTVSGLVPGEPPAEDRPYVFYFGNVGDDVDKCRRMCENERDCHSFSLHFMNFSEPVWQGQCYGRNSEAVVNEAEENVVSGIKKPCAAVSYDVEYNRNTVWGLVEYPGHEYRPDVMYFGNFGDDLTQCRMSCAAEPLCNSYSLHTGDFPSADWQGLCYGRSTFAGTRAREDNVISGIKVPATPVCFTEEPNTNTVHSLVEYVGWENRPKIFYFGQFEDDYARCREACAGEPRCHSWTLHFMNASATWGGHCYGRGTFNDRKMEELNIISGTRQQCDHVCFDRYEDMNAVHYLIPNPADDVLPHIFYFGLFGNDQDRCEQACAAHPSCYAWMLHLEELGSQWSGHCYGRDAYYDTLVEEQHTVTGIKKSCSEVCFDERKNTNTVWGVVDVAEHEDRPRTFYFGNFGNDVERCRKACEVEPYCESYSLHLTSFPAERWKGQCYGRGNHVTTSVAEENVISGVKQPCSNKAACFSQQNDHNTVWGLIPVAGLDEGRPDTIYLGKFDDEDVDRCKQSCAVVPDCISYSLHLSTHPGLDWRGTCYGRTDTSDVNVDEEHVISGYRQDCKKSDLGGGAIFGIVVTVLVAVLLIVFILAAVMRSRSSGETVPAAMTGTLGNMRDSMAGAWDKVDAKLHSNKAAGPMDVPSPGFDNIVYDEPVKPHGEMVMETMPPGKEDAEYSTPDSQA